MVYRNILLTPFIVAVPKLCGFHLLVLKKKTISALLVILLLVMLAARNLRLWSTYDVSGANPKPTPPEISLYFFNYFIIDS